MIVVEELRTKEDIAKALEFVGNSLFDQRVNQVEVLEALARKYNEHAHVLALLSDGMVVGLCAYYDNYVECAFISMLVIDRSVHHQGYGTKILQEVIHRCIDKRIRNIRLEVACRNCQAIAFYTKQGFRILKKDQEKMILEIGLCSGRQGMTEMNMEDKIIDFIKRNIVSTTEVSDCLGKDGVIPGLFPCTTGCHKVGKVKWVYAHNESNWSLHEQIKDIKEGNVIFVDTWKCGDRAVFGQLVSKYLLLYCRSEAIVVQGKLRDAAALIREKWPIWCMGYTPIGCFNTLPEEYVDEAWAEEHFQKYDGAVAICDDCGVVVIPKSQLNSLLLEKLQHIVKQEEIWFDRLDHHNENTFDIVCKKAYLDDENYMSKIIRAEKEV